MLKRAIGKFAAGLTAAIAGLIGTPPRTETTTAKGLTYAEAIKRREAARAARVVHGHRSGGSVRRALNLRGRAAFNEYRPSEAFATTPPAMVSELTPEMLVMHHQNRNAARARRRGIS
jgi:hypothetical protein